jgi:hypothetical protein
MAIEEMFTSLPTVSSAQMSDIICAVQGYVSPTNLGLSVQENLQQIYNLFQSNIILYNAGNPNGVLAGSTYQLCWDTLDGILYVCTVTGIASTAVWSKSITLTAGSGITIAQSGSNIVVSSSATGVTWNDVVTTSTSMAPNNGYFANNASLVTLTLPITAALGTGLYIVGQGAGGWTIAQNTGQQIQIGNTATTSGVGGSVSSTNQFDSLTLVCSVANTTWTLLGAPQSLGLTII